jgi:hypothetical protein
MSYGHFIFERPCGMISLVLRQAQDEENHQANIEENHFRRGLMLSLSKYVDALSRTFRQGLRKVQATLVCMQWKRWERAPRP